MKTIYLIACAKTKKHGTHKARDLYISPLFRKSLAYAEKHHKEGDRIFILSALYNVIDYDSRVDSYDLTLSNMSPDERRSWYDITAIYLHEAICYIGETVNIVVLAGELYIAGLRAFFDGCSLVGSLEEPLSGMQIGERLQFLNKELGL